MDNTSSNSYNKLIDNINKSINLFNNFKEDIDNYDLTKTNNIKEELKKFDIMCKRIQKTSDLCNYYNTDMKNILNVKNIQLNNKHNVLFPLIKNNIIKYIENKNTIPVKQKTNTVSIIKDNKNNYCKIDVIEVYSSSEVKNSPIYYIKDTDEFAIKINNKLMKGNIGICYDKTEKDTENLMECTNIKCNIEDCRYYHKEVKDNNQVNFMNYSWNYIKKNKHNPTSAYKKNKNVRFVGSRDTLNSDLLYTNKNEKKLRNSQLIHDILIYQVLANYLSSSC